ncbi:MAG: hypothetical protein RMX97_29560 [Nostoc sp. DedQUE11]|nr:hypothetical protein [Nostoc sp. DedQUE11]
MSNLIKILLLCKLIAINRYINLAVLIIIILINNLISNKVEAKNNPSKSLIKYLNSPAFNRKIALEYDSKKSAKNKLKNVVITQVFTQIPTNVLPTLNPSLPELINPFQSPESSPEQNNTIDPITPNQQNGNPVLKKKL